MANNGNIMLGFPNRIDQATLSGGSWTAGLPLTNLQNRLFARVARTTNAQTGSTQFVIDLGEPRRINIFALINHNISVTAKIRIETSGQSDFSTIQDSYYGDVWNGVANTYWDINALEWENDNFWIGSYSAEDIAGFTSISTQILDNFRSARYFRIRIEDSSNPAGYIQVGRVFIGPSIQPAANYSYGSGFGYETNTAVETALNGAEFFDVREPLRSIRFTLEMMSNDEAYGSFLEIIRRAGIHGEIFVIPDPEDEFNGLRRNFMGRNRQLNPLEQAIYADGDIANSMAFEIKELR